MDFDRMTSFVARAFTGIAFTFLAISVVEKIWNMLGAAPGSPGSIPGTLPTPRQWLDYAVILQIFVIPLLLRQIREQLKKP